MIFIYLIYGGDADTVYLTLNFFVCLAQARKMIRSKKTRPELEKFVIHCTTNKKDVTTLRAALNECLCIVDLLLNLGMFLHIAKIFYISSTN